MMLLFHSQASRAPVYQNIGGRRRLLFSVVRINLFVQRSFSVMLIDAFRC